MQSTLFDIQDSEPSPNRNVHHHAPKASVQAERSSRMNRDHHKVLVLGLVIRHPGQTAAELWAVATKEERACLNELQEVRRRLTDLLNDGDVIQSEKTRQCNIRGTSMHTWTAHRGN